MSKPLLDISPVLENVAAGPPLVEIDFALLAADDPDEAARLFSAAREAGTFYLDLQEIAEGELLLEHAGEMFGLAEKLRQGEAEEREYLKNLPKEGHPFATAYHQSRTMIVDEEGREDCNEWFTISKDDILSTTDYLATARLLNKNRYLLCSYVQLSHAVLTTILNSLNVSLGLAPGTLANLHRLSATSGDSVRIGVVSQPAQDGDEAASPAAAAAGASGTLRDKLHTLTLVFHRVGGLPPLSPGGDAQWEDVHALPGNAIVCLGDAMATFSNGLLTPSPHAVVSPRGRLAGLVQYEIAYFMRPEHGAGERRSEGL